MSDITATSPALVVCNNISRLRRYLAHAFYEKMLPLSPDYGVINATLELVKSTIAIADLIDLE